MSLAVNGIEPQEQEIFDECRTKMTGLQRMTVKVLGFKYARCLASNRRQQQGLVDQVQAFDEGDLSKRARRRAAEVARDTKVVRLQACAPTGVVK
jgi:hypothetical protein